MKWYDKVKLFIMFSISVIGSIIPNVRDMVKKIKKNWKDYKDLEKIKSVQNYDKGSK